MKDIVLNEDMESLFTQGKTWRKGQYLHISDSVADELVESGKASLLPISIGNSAVIRLGRAGGVGVLTSVLNQELEAMLQPETQTISGGNSVNIEPGHYSKPKTKRAPKKKETHSEGE